MTRNEVARDFCRSEDARDIAIVVAVWAVLVIAIVSAAWVRVQAGHDAAETAQVVAALRNDGGKDE